MYCRSSMIKSSIHLPVVIKKHPSTIRSAFSVFLPQEVCLTRPPGNLLGNTECRFSSPTTTYCMDLSEMDRPALGSGPTTKSVASQVLVQYTTTILNLHGVTKCVQKRTEEGANSRLWPRGSYISKLPYGMHI